MVQPIAASARLQLAGHEPRPASLAVTYRTPKTRATRAILSLLGFWALVPVVFFIPPHAPWALAAFGAGIFFAHRQWNGEYVVHHFEGPCPRCDSPLSLPDQARISLPHAMVCYQCHHHPVLTTSPGA